MHIRPKDVIRFRIGTEPDASLAEIRIRPTPAGGWESRIDLVRTDRAVPLGRVFRAQDRNLCAGKMITWLRRRFATARPISELQECRIRSHGPNTGCSAGGPADR